MRGVLIVDLLWREREIISQRRQEGRLELGLEWELSVFFIYIPLYTEYTRIFDSDDTVIEIFSYVSPSF